MEKGEKRLKQEDCHEDSLGSGILTLTNKRLAFDKTTARIADFTKRFGDTIIDVSLNDIVKIWKEGIFLKKICFTGKTNEGEKTFKFGVLGTGGWLNAIEDAIEDFKYQ